MRASRYTEDEMLALIRRYPDTDTAVLAAELGRSPQALATQAAKMGLRKSAAFRRAKAQDPRIAVNQFRKGQVPPNKGLRRPGFTVGRMAETQFRKGQASHTWRPVGTVVQDADGYLKRKVSDLRAPSRRDWKFVHVLLWEEHHGPVPPGHAVVFKDGDKARICIENLECITRRALMLRNSVHTLPPEIVGVVQLRGAVMRRINRMEKDACEKQD